MELREYVHWAAIGLSALTAALYLLIGLNVVSIGEISAREQRAFGIPAALVFAGGAVVSLFWDQRWLWIVGALGLALIIAMYFSISSKRVPRFETWGILIRVVQFPLLATLTFLAFTTPQS
jgi:hypothetical protein